MPAWIGVPIEAGRVQADADETVRVGDTVAIYRGKGVREEYEVTRLEGNGFVGVAWDRKSYRVEYNDLEKLWVKRWKWQPLPLPPIR